MTNGAWGYLADNFCFTETQSEGDDQLWQFVMVDDNTFHIVNCSGEYIVPAGTITGSDTAPANAWSVAPSDTEGLYVLYCDATSVQMHANKDTRLVNWGYNANGSGPIKNDAGCNFEFVEGKRTSTGIDPSEITNHKSEMTFDLMGRRVANPTKGIYIMGGKKVIK